MCFHYDSPKRFALRTDNKTELCSLTKVQLKRNGIKRRPRRTDGQARNCGYAKEVSPRDERDPSVENGDGGG
jgi:hypothetical protein